jgi:hypothetical protein
MSAPPAGPPPLSAAYNRHRILVIDQTVGRQLILLLQSEHPPLLQRKAILKVIAPTGQGTKYVHVPQYLVGIGTLPPSLSPASVSLPPKPRCGGGGANSSAGGGLGESQFQRLEKKLSTLPTLWGWGSGSQGADPHPPFLYAREGR